MYLQVVCLRRYYNLLFEKKSVACTLLSPTLTCSGEANFLLYPMLFTDNVVSHVLCHIADQDPTRLKTTLPGNAN